MGFGRGYIWMGETKTAVAQPPRPSLVSYVVPVLSWDRAGAEATGNGLAPALRAGRGSPYPITPILR